MTVEQFRKTEAGRMGHARRLKAKLRALIEASPLSYDDIARELGVAKSTAWTWANEDKPATPRGEQLLALARLLGVTVDYLLDDAQEGPPRVLSDDERTAIRLVWELIERGEAAEAIARLMQVRGDRRDGSGRAARPAATHLAKALGQQGESS